MKTASFKDLIVWQRAIELVEALYKLTDKFPGVEVIKMLYTMVYKKKGEVTDQQLNASL